MSDRNGVRLGSLEAVRLVAGRELSTRLRSKAFQVTTVVLALLVVAFAVIMQLVNAKDDSVRVGFTSASAALQPGVVASGRALGTSVRPVSVDDEAAGRAKVRDGDLDALLVGMQDGRLTVVVDEELDDALRPLLTSATAQSVLDDSISELGGDPGAVAEKVARVSLDVAPLDPNPSFDPQRLAVGSIAGILIYLALISTGQSVAQGVVEEKSSRVVELLLATVRPWQLMAGKVLGIGLVGLIQVAVVGVVGIVAGQLTGTLTLSFAASASVVLWLVVWFVLGFTLYSLVFAGAGALVSRQEDVGGVTTPAMMFLVVGYVVGISVLPADPSNTIVSIMSLIPVFSPTLMPMRLAMGGVPLWQTLVSLGLALAVVPVLVVGAGRIYRNGVVRTGARVRLREALSGD